MDDSHDHDRPQAEEPSEIDYLYYRVTFLENALFSAAIRSVDMEFEHGPRSEIVKRLVDVSIYKGLEIGLFRPDDDDQEIPRPRGGIEVEMDWPDKIPWGVAVGMAAQLGVDANLVRARFVAHHKDRLDGASKLGPVEELADHVPPEVIEGLRSVADRIAEKIAQQMSGSGAYMLHCRHSGHDCQHPYESLEDAIDGAAHDLDRGLLESVTHITFGGEVVMDESKLAERVENRIDLMRSARNN